MGARRQIAIRLWEGCLFAKLWLGREPALERHVRVELRRHPDPFLVTSLGPSVRGTRLAAREIIAKPSGECGGFRGRAVHDHIALFTCVLSERASGTTVDAIAEFLLRRADLCQQRHGIERPVLRAQPLLYGLGDHRMRQSSLRAVSASLIVAP
jgi:hypothetical protein